LSASRSRFRVNREFSPGRDWTLRSGNFNIGRLHTCWDVNKRIGNVWWRLRQDKWRKSSGGRGRLHGRWQTLIVLERIRRRVRTKGDLGERMQIGKRRSRSGGSLAGRVCRGAASDRGSGHRRLACNRGLPCGQSCMLLRRRSGAIESRQGEGISNCTHLNLRLVSLERCPSVSQSARRNLAHLGAGGCAGVI